MRPLLLFSGGVDSTYLLLKTLKEYDCDILTIDHSYNLPSRLAEQQAREKILKAIAKDPDIPFKVVDHIRVTGDFQPIVQGARVSYGQLFGHLQYIFQHLDYDNHSEVILGLLVDDDSAQIHHDLGLLWKQHHRVFGHMYARIPELSLPLGETKKAWVIKRLDHRYLKMAWYCCTPNHKRKKWVPCGICISCKDHERAVEDVSLVDRQYTQLDKSLQALAKLTPPEVIEIKD